ncbi:MAG: hypothetical protein JXB03_10100 [Spirochaetales bacterium]|nr:hypothetical protein [Spirochaetales bacterium]
MNAGLVFIKPHAAVPGVISFVETSLAHAGITIEQKGRLKGSEIESRGIIDRHYFAISKTAMKTDPADLSLSSPVYDEFRGKFGTGWEEALAGGKMYNSAQYMERHRILSGETLTAVWTSGAFMKLGPGLYVCKVPETGEFLINGFYPGMREKFTRPDALVLWYAVAFDEAALPWKNFRSLVIGATDPSKAADGSIRKQLYADFSRYGLSSRPSMSDNGVHASAGPIEGMRERMVWAGIPPQDSELGTALERRGLGSALTTLLENSEAVYEGNKGPVFDITEDADSSAVAASLSLPE